MRIRPSNEARSANNGATGLTVMLLTFFNRGEFVKLLQFVKDECDSLHYGNAWDTT